ncbi:MAG: hypothetical protein IPK18_07205 [Sphingobacteriales bacterium]|nr:MAG: hypothetical protein IPK18_07205 [Sphingobacteriales bacterium]
MKTILFYNLYCVNNWLYITKDIFQYIPQDDVVVNINFDIKTFYRAIFAYMFFLKQKKVKKILITVNSRTLGEVKGLQKFRKQFNLDKYNILTYAHAKGVTKPNHKGVADWREVMRYFIFDRFEDTIGAFKDGYYLYGAMLSQNKVNGEIVNQEKLGVSHWYRGTFVSVNLSYLRNEFKNKPIQQNYLGSEAFFGSLCNFEKCYNAHSIEMSLYQNEYPENLYKKNKNYV